MKNRSFPLANMAARGAGAKTGALSQGQAEELAVAALAYIAAEPELLEPFLSLTGLIPEEIREIAAQPRFLTAVLDHLLAHEGVLLEFCESGNHDPRNILAARNRLGGAPAWDSA